MRKVFVVLLSAFATCFVPGESAGDPVDAGDCTIEMTLGAAPTTETVRLFLDETKASGAGFDTVRWRVESADNARKAEQDAPMLPVFGRAGAWEGVVSLRDVFVGLKGLRGSVEAQVCQSVAMRGVIRMEEDGGEEIALEAVPAAPEVYPVFHVVDQDGVGWEWGVIAASRGADRPEGPWRFAFDAPFSIDVQTKTVGGHIEASATIQDSHGSILRSVTETSRDGERRERLPRLEVRNGKGETILDERLRFG